MSQWHVTETAKRRLLFRLDALGLPLTYALYAIERSMGMGDLDPFVLTPPVLHKPELVHERVTEASGASRGS